MRYVLFMVFVVFAFASLVKADRPSQELKAAQIQVESGGDDSKIGDQKLKDKAYGHLQIRQTCVNDYNKWHKDDPDFKQVTAEDCRYNRGLSEKIYDEYIDYYATTDRLGHEPTDEDKARIWNGGPCGCFDNGALNKYGKKPKTAKSRDRLVRTQRRAKRYWEKEVRPILEK